MTLLQGRPAVRGPVRRGRRTKRLLRRLRCGEVAVIDHADLDRVAADGLIARGVQAVLNASASTSQRFPNRGPQRLVQAGIVHLDRLGPKMFDMLADGDLVTVQGEAVFRGGELLAWGRRWNRQRDQARQRRAQQAYAGTFRAFMRNTAHHLLAELDAFPHPLTADALRDELAGLAAGLQGRPVLVVARGPGHRRDLPLVLARIHHLHPAILAVDGAADALLAMDLEPSLIVGDMDSVSDQTLAAVPQRVVHAYPDGHAPGLARTARLGLPVKIVAAPGTSEDLALMIAAACDGQPIILVGGHRHPVDFLEKGRPGMGSTVLTRMALGPRLVDLSGLGQLQPARPGLRRGPWRRLWSTAVRWPAAMAALLLLGIPLAGLVIVAPIWQNMLRFGLLYVRVAASAPF